MITLITGTPGAGKTLYAVSQLLPTFEGRPLYVDGINDLVTAHELPGGQIEERVETAASGRNQVVAVDPECWADWLPDHGVLVVDECQRIWRPRGTGTRVPAGVSAMETHRHRGQDLVLITQHPNLLDANVRRLVGRHIHVRRVWGWSRAVTYEWDTATDPTRLSTAIKGTWAYPKSAFGLYKSATVHTARGQKPPMVFWVIGLAIAGTAIGGYLYAGKLNDKAKGGTGLPTGQAQPTGLQAGAVALGQAPPGVDFIPRTIGRPESAPAYDGIARVQAAPVVVACVASVERCICYTAQATRATVGDRECRDRAAGLVFDPYAAPLPPTPAPTMATPLPSLEKQPATFEPRPPITGRMVPRPEGAA